MWRYPKASRPVISHDIIASAYDVFFQMPLDDLRAQLDPRRKRFAPASPSQSADIDCCVRGVETELIAQTSITVAQQIVSDLLYSCVQKRQFSGHNSKNGNVHLLQQWSSSSSWPIRGGRARRSGTGSESVECQFQISSLYLHWLAKPSKNSSLSFQQENRHCQRSIGPDPRPELKYLRSW